MRSVVSALCLVVLAGLTAGCGATVPRSEYDRLEEAYRQVSDEMQRLTLDFERIQAELAQARMTADGAEGRMASLEAERDEARAKLQAADVQLAALREQLASARAEAGRLSADLEAKLRELQAQYPDTFVLRPDGVLAVKDVLFDSGKAELKDSAKQALGAFGEIMKGRDESFQIVGHTDSDPIKSSAALWRTKENMELSLARALAVWMFLRDQGVARERMSAAGFGEWRPAAEGDAKEVKAANRRVEIWMVPPGR